jgi:N-dimethylarginine dimethylaminohydrolase
MKPRILVCNPAFYEVTYKINPWMDPEAGINTSLAFQQWIALTHILEQAGAEIVHMSGTENLPDIVFTANAGLWAGDNKIILSNFKYPERQLEKAVYKKWFESNGFNCSEFNNQLFFEGAGDALASSDKKIIYMGYGFRTDLAAIDIITKHFLSERVISIQLIDPYFYHLDTCFCPLPGDVIMIYPSAFEPNTIEFIKKHSNDPIILEIPENEARRFACNAVSVGNNVVIPSGCPETTKLLKSVGFDVFETDMSEYIKAGGACKCLTFKLNDFN